MRFSAGTRLGPYELLEMLGAGGMGEVYRARDTRLGRDVAIKILPAAFSSNAERLRRFEQEARTVGALNHPHILALYDIGSQDGSPFLVTELLEGETLRERLDQGALASRKAVDIAVQIANGLAAAHEKGIVHRDLKPENVFVTKEGRVKILDFGLAKLTLPEPAGDLLTSAPTTPALTDTGVVMGTAGYMSPEQVQGEKADARSDIFAFGAVLYEMLSGRRAFKGASAIETMHAILKVDPPELSGSQPGVSPSLDRIARRCLEKDQLNRFQSAKDIAFALSEASSQAMTSGALTTAPVSGKTKVFIAAAVIVVLAAAGVLLLRRSNKAATEAGGVKRLAVLPFENLGAAEDGYFADGMTDEVRSKLSALSGLTVIASTSSGQYKATTKPADQIAKELGVGYLLVAKVRWQKSGQASRIRVIPELVDVGGGGAPTTRWQEAFDADLSDVFKVQGEIAARVAKALDVVLSGKDRAVLAARPTSNLAAYDAYLKGMEILEKEGDLRAAVAQFEQAVALDPDFALAWAMLSMEHSNLYLRVAPSPQNAEAARRAAERAVELSPELPRSANALAWYHAAVRKDEARARELLSHALKVAPNDVELLVGSSQYEEDRERKLELLHRAEVLDPRSSEIQMRVAGVLLTLRRGIEARAACDRGLAISPSSFTLDFIHSKVMTYLQQGDLAGARAVIAAAPKEVRPTALIAALGSGYDLDWVLNDAQRDVLLRLTPGAFADDRANWGIVLAQAASRHADVAKVREYAEEARKSFAAKVVADPDNGESRVFLGLSLAYLGKKEEAVREGERAVALRPVLILEPTYHLHQLVRIHILCGNYEKALDLLEPLLKVPYYLTPDWLRIDPNFDPLRKNPRFQRLVAGT